MMNPFTLDALENYQLKSGLLTAHLEQGQSDPYQQRIKASGHIPPGHFGELVLEEQNKQMAELCETIRPHVNAPLEDIEVNLPINGGRLIGWLTEHYAGGLVRIKPGNIKGRELLRHYIEHLCYCASVESPYQTRIIGTNAHLVLQPLLRDEALHALEQLVGRNISRGCANPCRSLSRAAWSWLEAGHHWLGRSVGAD